MLLLRSGLHQLANTSPARRAILVPNIHNLGSTFEHKWIAVSFWSYVDCEGRLFNGGVAANPEILDVVFSPLHTGVLKYFFQALFQSITTIGNFSRTRYLHNLGMLVRQNPRDITPGKRTSYSLTCARNCCPVAIFFVCSKALATKTKGRRQY